MKTKVRTYRPSALIDGSAIGEQAGTSWVAVPDRYGEKVCVLYNGSTMDIRSWRHEAGQFKRFRDKFWTAGSNRPQYYTLGYFRWTPQI